MKEVAGHFALNFLNQCGRSGLSTDELWAGINTSPKELERRGARLDWDEFALFLSRWETALGGEENWLEHARTFGRNEELRYLSRLASLFASPRLLYRLMCDWMGPSLSSNLQFKLTAAPDGTFEVEMWIEPHFRPSRLFFMASAGAFETMTCHLGLGPARLDIVRYSGHHALYRIFPPASRTVAAQVRAAFGWIGGATSLVRVLRSQNDELRKSHATLERQQEDFHAILNNAAEGIAIVDRDRVLYANPALRGLLGGDREQAFENGLTACVDASDRAAWTFFWETLCGAGKPDDNASVGEHEFRFRSVDGRLIWLALSPPRRVRHAGREGWLVATRDVTEIRALRDAVAGAADAERHRIARDLHDGLGQILTGVSFKARTLQMMGAHDPAGAGQLANEIVDLAQTASVHARSLAHGLDVLISGKDISAALRQLSSEAARNLETTVDIIAPPRLDVGESTVALEIVRVVQEAVHNAARHGDAKNVRVSLRQDPGRLVLDIADDGKGVPPEVEAAEGMGTRVMRYRVTRLGGSFALAHRQGEGVNIRCEFPVSIVAAPVVGGRIAAPATRVLRDHARGPLHVFVADDHAIVRAGMVELLTRDPAIQVVGETGKAAEIAAAVSRLRPDALLIDLQMQGQDTLPVIRAVRHSHPEMRIVVISMFDAKVHGQAATEAGADAYVTKSEAAGRLREALGLAPFV